MDATIGSLLGVAGSAAIGLVVYAWQERMKRATALADKRTILYDGLVRGLVVLIAAETSEARSTLLSEIEKAWLYASDDVLEACYAYLALYDDVCSKNPNDVVRQVRDDKNNIKAQIEDALAAVYFAMRADLSALRPTRRNLAWAKEHVTIYEWGILAQRDAIAAEARSSAAATSPTAEAVSME